jgi:hypothetical protein
MRLLITSAAVACASLVPTAAASAAVIDPGTYRGVTSQGKKCGTRGKARCTASAQVSADMTATFRWKFHVRCSDVTRLTYRSSGVSDPIPVGSGNVDFTDVLTLDDRRETEVTTVIRGSFSSASFVGTMRVTLRAYHRTRSSTPERLTCRTRRLTLQLPRE